ncbi:MAG: Gmad2 immunoglobulin-like domain-containing protein [Micromonosporaceae bacterium]
MKLRHLLLASLLLGLAALTGCTDAAGSRGTAPTAAPKPSPSSHTASRQPSPQPTSDAPAGHATSAPRSITIELWLTRNGRLFHTVRTRSATAATTKLALRELIAGATQAEAAAGVSTALPSETTFSASVSGGVATVSFPASFYAGGRDLARLRQAQVVYTLTQFATVSKVGFQRDGEALGWPAGRSAYADVLPAIVVTSPRIGAQVRSPVTITGTANVYEATVSVRILDAAGREIATGFTTATCGSGCRGRFSTSLSFQVSTAQTGRIQVYEVSAEDGSRVNVVDIPVSLQP